MKGLGLQSYASVCIYCTHSLGIPMTVRSKNETWIFKAVSSFQISGQIEWNLISLFDLALVS